MPAASIGFLRYFSWLPSVHALMLSYPVTFAEESVLYSSVAFTAGYATPLLVAALRQFRKIREIEQEYLQLNASKS